jgi:hypothetical protein
MGKSPSPTSCQHSCLLSLRPTAWGPSVSKLSAGSGVPFQPALCPLPFLGSLHEALDPRSTMHISREDGRLPGNMGRSHYESFIHLRNLYVCSNLDI